MSATLAFLGGAYLSVMLTGFASADASAPTIVSGQANLKISRSGDPQRWWRLHATVSLDASLAALGPEATDAVIKGFGNWIGSASGLPALTFDAAHRSKVSLVPDGINRVQFAPIELAGHEDDLAITIAFADEHSGQILEADIVINSRHRFGVLDPLQQTNVASCSGSMPDDCQGLFDLESVVSHEAGHFFGLGEDRHESDATMYQCTSRCEVHKRDLTAADLQVVTELYAEPREPTQASIAGCAIRSPGSSCPAGWLATLPVLGSLLASGRRRQRRARGVAL